MSVHDIEYYFGEERDFEYVKYAFLGVMMNASYRYFIQSCKMNFPCNIQKCECIMLNLQYFFPFNS